MKSKLTVHFVRSFDTVPHEIQRAFDKQSKMLLDNIRHPSLRAKKYDESSGIWQARVTGDWRFYFLIEKDTYVLLEIKKHPK